MGRRLEESQNANTDRKSGRNFRFAKMALKSSIEPFDDSKTHRPCSSGFVLRARRSPLENGVLCHLKRRDARHFGTRQLFKKPPEYKLRRRYLAMKIICAALALLLAYSVYFNFDYTVFKLLIAGNYIYTDALESIYKEKLGDDNFTDSFFRDFDAVVIGVFTEKIRATNGDKYTYLYTPVQLKAENASEQIVANETEITALSDYTVYLRIPNVSEHVQKFIFDNKEMLKGYDNIIIDMQSNYGGSINVLYKLAELFLPKGSVISSEITRIGFFTKTVKSKREQYVSYNNIVILINGGTASAAEGFTMSLRENLDNVTIIGRQSFGKGIGQITLPLLRGYAVKATVLRVETPLGNSIHGVGITPDIEYGDEDILEYALEFAER